MDLYNPWIVLRKAWIHDCTIPGLHELWAVILYRMKGRFLPRRKWCLTMKEWSMMVDRVASNDFIQQNFVEKKNGYVYMLS